MHDVSAAAAGGSEGNIAASSDSRVQCYGDLHDSDALTNTSPYCCLGLATDPGNDDTLTRRSNRPK